MKKPDLRQVEDIAKGHTTSEGWNRSSYCLTERLLSCWLKKRVYTLASLGPPGNPASAQAVAQTSEGLNMSPNILMLKS